MCIYIYIYIMYIHTYGASVDRAAAGANATCCRAVRTRWPSGFEIGRLTVRFGLGRTMRARLLPGEGRDVSTSDKR